MEDGPAKKCSVEGCCAPIRARGMCNKHYLRFRRYGNPDYTHIAPSKILFERGLAKCSVCKVEKTIDQFVKDSTTCTGVSVVCKTCFKTLNLPRKRAYAAKAREWCLRKAYGLEPGEYNKLLLQQDGVCAICEKDILTNGKYFSVDHCHTTGKVRGLLCDTCNRGLGMFQDSPIYLQAACAYLKKAKENS